jgi:long-chain acyl-CoA synthetase
VTPQPVKGFTSLVELFLWRARQSPERPALWAKRDGRYLFVTWKEFEERVRELALALEYLGVKPGDRVGLLAENRPEWAFADLAILSLGAATVPIYPTSSLKECRYVLEHAEVSLVLVSTADQWQKVKPLLEGGRLRTVIGFDLPSDGSRKLLSLEELLEIGRRMHLNNWALYDQRVARVGREDLATLIYTSGTTGPPKGVMLTHGNFLSNCEASAQGLPFEEGEKSFSFLPLSHVFERMAGYYFAILEGASIAYAESMQTVGEDMLLVRPTVAASVPRFFEKSYTRILEKVESGSSLKRSIFYWALKVGKASGRYRSRRVPMPFSVGISFALARNLVFSRIKEGFGGRIKFFISGGAPLAKELAEFFFAADILILEGYGLTETSPVISVNRPGRFKFGTVGPLLPGVEVRIAEDGEILTRGPHVMKGYFKNEEATRQAIRDGWFYTGDIGELDSEGFLKITGRKKDLIITAGGKNISPQNIENEILGDPLISQVVVLGDRKPYLVALIVPSQTELLRLAEAQGISSQSWEELLMNPGVQEIVSQRIQGRTRDFASYEQIKYFQLLAKELTQASGELTPTLKVKRAVVMERYASAIEAMYRKGETRAKSGDFARRS